MRMQCDIVLVCTYTWYLKVRYNWIDDSDKADEKRIDALSRERQLFDLEMLPN